MQTAITSSHRRSFLLCLLFIFSLSYISYANNSTKDIPIFNNIMSEVSVSANPSSVVEDGISQFFYTITRNCCTEEDLTVNFSLSGTAINGTDYEVTSPSTSITIPAGATSAEVLINPTTDVLVEGDETIILTIESGTGYTPSATNNSATTTIEDDDVAEITIGDANISEGDDGTQDLEFTISISNPATQTINVTATTNNGTAESGTDYESKAFSVDFAPASVPHLPEELTQTIVIPITGDMLVEADEIFDVILSNALFNGMADANKTTITDNTGVGTIENDDEALISIADAEGLEGNFGTSPITFTLTLSKPASLPIEVDVETSAGTATAGTDYSDINTSVTFAAGETTQTVNVNANGDIIAEANETFVITLSNPQFDGTTGGNQVMLDPSATVATGTIINDDSPRFSIDDVTISEGNAGTKTMTFTVSVNPILTSVASIDYQTIMDSRTDATPATEEEDYEPINDGTLTFAAGNSSQTIDVTINGDIAFEGDETFIVELLNPMGSNMPTIEKGEGIGTITNDDLVLISVDDVTKSESDASSTFEFTVSLASSTTDVVTVDYEVTAESATDGSDFDVIGLTTLTFDPGDISKTISITVQDDEVVEADETFKITLSEPTATGDSNPMIEDGDGLGTIINDDQSEISIVDVSMDEGDSGTKIYMFEVTSTKATDAPFSITYMTNDDSATAGEDYMAASGELDFDGTANETKTIEVTVNGDEVVEINEVFKVMLTQINTDGLDIVFTDDTADGTIINDEDAVISIEPAKTIMEGDAGETANLEFVVTLDKATSESISIDFTTMDDSATEADNDYETTAGTLTFSGTAGETKTISVRINGDDVVEPDEDFKVEISNLQNQGLSVTLENDGATETSTGTIENDDNTKISVGDATLTEGNTGTSDLEFTVSLSNPAASDITVQVNTSDDNTAGTSAATADEDYDALVNQTVTITAGQTSQTFTVTINNETIVELDEHFFVNISNAAGAEDLMIETDQGTGTIENDDAATLVINDISEVEGDADTKTFTFTVTLDAATGNSFTVDYTTVDDSAVASDAAFDGNDYEMTSGNLDFAGTANETQPIVVTINSDVIVEADQVFDVVLSNLVAGGLDITLAKDTGIGTIENDDATTISINDVSVMEGDNGETDLTFIVELSNKADHEITVDAATAAATATGGGDDFIDFSGMLSFAPNVDEQVITIKVKGDNIVEDDETFEVNLSSPTGNSSPTISDGQGIGTITNDDSAEITIDDITGVDAKNEADAATDNFTFTITLSQPVDRAVSIDAISTAGTATGGGTDYEDYPATTITFAAGETTKEVIVDYNDDALVEGDEDFTVDLNTLDNGGLGNDVTITDDSGLGTIIDDDATEINISQEVSELEGNSGTQNYEYTVTLTNSAQYPITVDVNTIDGSATAGDNDYNTLSETLTFGEGELSKTVTVVVNGDIEVEDNESFTVDLSNPQFDGATDTDRVTIDMGTSTGVILNDDSPTINIAPSEANEDEATLSFTVTANFAAQSNITVEYMTMDGTASDENGDSDYVNTTGTVTLVAGQTSTAIDIPLTPDTKVEADETFTVKIKNPSGDSNPTIGTDEAIGTITNDDNATVDVNTDTRNEANAGSEVFEFNVTLSNPVDEDVTVTVSTADDTATGGGTDYTDFSTTVTFLAGEVSKTVNVSYLDDAIVEADETFTMDLSALNNGDRNVILGDNGVGTIMNDDATELSIDDIMLDEGNLGTTPFNFTVTSTSIASEDIQFTVMTEEITLNNDDYNNVNSTFTLPAGETSVIVPVNVQGDTGVEPDETFSVNLSTSQFAGQVDATRVSISDAQGLGTILNDDTQTFDISDATVIEGDFGDTPTMSFTVTTSDGVSGISMIDYATQDGTAIAGGLTSDYMATSGTLTFTAGITEQTINVTVNGDSNTEENENFFVNLTNPRGTGNPQIGDGQGEGTIINDDSPNFTISDAVVLETDNTMTTTATFTVTLNSPNGDASVAFTTMDGSSVIAGENATAGEDYMAQSNNNLSFPNGTTSRDIIITIFGDEKVELDQLFTVNLSNPTGTDVTISDGEGVGTITNDDAATLTIADVTLNEGMDETMTDFVFAVTLDKELDNAATVEFTTNDDSATDGEDYTGVNGTLEFVGDKDEVQNITVTVKGDNIAEANEAFNTVLSNIEASGLDVTFAGGDDTGVGTITNDDFIEISIDDVESVESSSELVFTVSLDKAADHPITVNASTEATTATGGGTDYTDLVNTPVTFAAGETEQTVTVTVNNDDIVENDETLFINLTDPAGVSNPTIADAQGLGTIANDDKSNITIDDISVNEADAGSSTANFTISLTKAADRDIMIDVATQEATATGGDVDYTDKTQTLTITAGSTTAAFMVTYIDDEIVEEDENFAANLSELILNGLSNEDISITDDNGIGTIIDDDVTEISIADNTAVESAGSLVFTVTLTKAASKTIMVTANTSHTSTNDDDYTILSDKIITIPAGQTSTLLAITLNDDDIVEEDETFDVTLTNPLFGGATDDAVTISDGTATGTITDNDMTEVSIADQTANEGDGTIDFEVSLSNIASQDITVTVNTTDGTADGTDFTALTDATVTIPAGQSSATASVILNDDDLVEATENFTITISDPQLNGASNADVTLGNATATGSIEDNDETEISIADVTLAEEDGTATFTVSLTQTASQDITIVINTSPGTAGNSDFEEVDDLTVTIPAGQTSATFDVTITNDEIVEADETFNILVSNVRFGGEPNENVTVASGAITGTITNVADQAQISIADNTANESEGTLEFVVSTDKVASQDISVTINTATGTATAADFDALSDATVTIPAGQSMMTISVNIEDDMIVESAEDFTATITNPTFGGSTDDEVTIGANDTATGTITDNDEAVVTIEDIIVDEDAGTAMFTAKVDLEVAGGFTLEVNTADGTAVADGDYTSVANQPLAFAGDANETQSFTVTIADDMVVEANETFTVSMDNVSNQSIDITDTATGIIRDNDEATVTIEDKTVNESDGSIMFTATVDKAVQGGFTVDVSSADGTALTGSDYTAIVNQTLTFAGDADEEENFTISITDDMLVENDETFTVAMGDASKENIITDDIATATITDNDVAEISIDDITLNEGNSGTTDFEFTVTLSKAAASPIAVDVATAENTALAGSDFEHLPANTTVNFAAGVTSQTITVNVNGDIDVENDETFFVNLSNPTFDGSTSSSRVSIEDDMGTGTITNDDRPIVSIADAAIFENMDGSTSSTLTFTVTLNQSAPTPTVVSYSTQDETAEDETGDADYISKSGTVTFAPGETTMTVDITINNNDIVEADETFLVNLTNASGNSNPMISSTEGTATGTIKNDDAATISVNNISRDEANASSDDFEFTVSLSNPVDSDVSVTVSTGDDTATGGGTDYNDFTMPITFAAGETSKTVTITYVNDNIVENDETFAVELSALNNGDRNVNLGSNGTGIITNDDATAISINDISLEEGNSGTTAFNFTISLTNPSAQDISFKATTNDGTAMDGGVDYNDVNNTFSIPAGMTSTEVTVNVIGDITVEEDETFTLDLDEPKFGGMTDATRVTISDAQGAATIENDDDVTFSIENESIMEGNSGTATMTFTITASSPVENTTQIAYATADDSAEAASDYSATTGTVTFNATETSKTFTVSINGDEDTEPNETFFVNLSDGGMGNPQFTDAQAIGTIINDDSPSFSIDNQTITETNSGTVTATFTVTLNNPGANEATVEYTTMDGSATAGEDYTAKTGTLSFPNGTPTQTIEISISGDEKVELDQDFKVMLSNAAGDDEPTIAVETGTGTITNDDTATLTITDNSATEGSDITFNVTLDKELDNSLKVDYITSDNTATAGSDYTGSNGQLTFDGSSINDSKTIIIATSTDNIAEADELFNVILSNIQASGLAVDFAANDDTAEGQITNDDIPLISINDITQAENMTDFVFKVSMNIAADHEITVPVSSSEDSATGNGEDFTDLSSTTLSFAAGETEKMVIITVNNDNIVEDTEQFFVNLGSATGTSNPVVVKNQGIGTINNDDTALININDVSMNESAASSPFTFMVSLTNPADREITLNVATAGATATSGADYSDKSMMLTFAAGETSKEFTVDFMDDDIVEGDENFAVNLSQLETNALSGVTIGDGNGIGMILDNDTAEISISNETVAENNGTVSFTVSMDKVVDKTVRVAVATTANSATTDDYTTLTTTVVFDEGETSKTVEVDITNDNIVEVDEAFDLDIETITATDRNVIKGTDGRATIQDDDSATININDITALEGDNGTTDFVFEVSLSAPIGGTISMDFATTNGTANSNSDYDSNSGSVSFTKDDPLTKTVTIKVNGDTQVEEDETFTVILFNLTKNSLDVSFDKKEGTGTITNDEALPLDWLSFHAKSTKENTVALSWRTANEVDNELFVIERSLDGIQFEEIGTLQAISADSEAFSYNFEDKAPLNGNNYYRIRQIDVNGKYSLSVVRLVNISKITVEVFPNPTIEMLNIIYNGTNDEAISIRIVDNRGQLLYNGKVQLSNGQFNMNLAQFNIHESGIYHLAIQNADGSTQTIQFVKLSN